jgi:hypothetical protein
MREERPLTKRGRGRGGRYCLQLERYQLDAVSVEFEFGGEGAKARPGFPSDPLADLGGFREVLTKSAPGLAVSL